MVLARPRFLHHSVHVHMVIRCFDPIDRFQRQQFDTAEHGHVRAWLTLREVGVLRASGWVHASSAQLDGIARIWPTRGWHQSPSVDATKGMVLQPLSIMPQRELEPAQMYWLSDSM
jgi:hypothetical protein